MAVLRNLCVTLVTVHFCVRDSGFVVDALIDVLITVVAHSEAWRSFIIHDLRLTQAPHKEGCVHPISSCPFACRLTKV